MIKTFGYFVKLVGPGGGDNSGGFGGGSLDSSKPWRVVVELSQDVYRIITMLIDALVNVFTRPLEQVLTDFSNTSSIEWVSAAFTWIVEFFDLSNVSLFSMMLYSGLSLWVVISLFKWVIR